MLQPLSQREWTPALAAHLLNRAGFGGSPEEVETLYEKGVETAVGEIVDYAGTPDPYPAPGFAKEGAPDRPNPRELAGLSEEERRNRRREFIRTNRMQLNELRGWWLERMRTTPRPLQEKLTLFWHGHFATGFRKVRSTYAMYLQNETLRKHASGNWEGLLGAVSRDPAMLIYLDGARSTRKAPNENYGRELMELFVLGEGHYTEEDVRAAARAFTGWSLDRKSFAFTYRKRAHDPGTKTFLGEKGAFDGDDIIRILLDHPEAAPFICRKLWAFFAYDAPEPELEAALARSLRTNGYEFKPLLETIFRSREFYSSRAGRTQIKGPVQWLVSAVRYLEAPLPPPGVSLNILTVLGQDLFEPPNVAGWEGGTAWITTAALLHRYNLAAVLTEGGDRLREVLGARMERQAGRMMMAGSATDIADLSPSERRRRVQEVRRQVSRPVMDPDRVLPAAARTDKTTAARHLQWRLFQSRLREQDTHSFQAFVDSLDEPSSWTDADIRQVVHAMMSTPQFQLT